jgi:hypothetical protein
MGRELQKRAQLIFEVPLLVNHTTNLKLDRGFGTSKV